MCADRHSVCNQKTFNYQIQPVKQCLGFFIFSSCKCGWFLNIIKNHHFCPGLDYLLLITHLWMIWFWNFYFMHRMQSGRHRAWSYILWALSRQLMVFLFMLLFLRKWAAHQIFTRLTSWCADAGHIRAQRSSVIDLFARLLTAIPQLLVLTSLYQVVTFD